MVHVPENVQSCRDFVGHVAKLLELEERGGDGDLPLLSLDGFLVPHGEEIRAVLNDDEVVDVMTRTSFVRPSHMGAKRPLPLGNVAATSDKNNAEVAPQASKRPRVAAAPTYPSSPAQSTISQQKRGAQAQTPPQAIGWQSPEASPAPRAVVKANGKAAVVVSKGGKSSSSEDSSSEEEKPAPVLRVKAPHPAAREPQKQPAAQEAAAPPSSSSEALGLFVGGLPWSVDDARLAKHFSSFGNVVSASVVMNINTGTSKGFGFVEFGNVGSVVKALAAGSKQELEGRTIEVKPRDGTGKGGKGKGKDKGKSKGKDQGKGKARGRAAIADFDNGGDSTSKGASKGSEAKAGTESSESGADAPGTSSAAAAAAKAKLAAIATNSASTNSGANASRKNDGEEELDEETKQMIALGLPVSFKANVDQGSDEEDEEDDGDDE